MAVLAFVHAVQKIPVSGLQGTCGRFTTRAILCQLRPLASIQDEGILDQLQVT